MTTQHPAGGEWHTQLGTWLGAVAIALSLYALLRDNPNTRDSHGSGDQSAVDIQLRDTIVKLQESMGVSPTGEQTSSAKSWLYFQSAEDLIVKKKAAPSLAGLLVLSNFAFAHSDVALGNHFLTLASNEVKRETSPVTQCLARAAMAHFMFEHAPTTPLSEGRDRFAEALAEANKLTGSGAPFVQLNILQEWALDEYAAGEADAGDEQHAAAIKLLGNEAFSPAFRAAWEQDMDTSIIRAKVRGKLL